MIESKVELFLLEVDQNYLELKQQNLQDLHQFV